MINLLGQEIFEGMNHGETKALCGCKYIVEYVKHPTFEFVQRAVMTKTLPGCDHSKTVEQWQVR